MQTDRKTTSYTRYSLQTFFGGSWLIVFLMTSVSIAGLRFPADFYPTESFRESFFPNDVVNLVVGLPVMLAAMWGAHRGRLSGLLLWPGALIYVLYTYLTYLLALPFGWGTLAYLVLVVLCLYLLVGLLAGLDGEAVAERLRGQVPERFSAGVLIGLGALFMLRVLGVLVGELIDVPAVTDTELAVHIADILVSPAMVIGGLLLWQKKGFGYLSGLGLLFQSSMLFVALIALMILQPIMTDAPFAAFDIVIVAVMGLICFVPMGLFYRGVGRASA